MMAELIRTSMFCDNKDILTDDELHFLVNYEHSCSHESVVDDCPSPYNQDSYNFLEFVARTTDNVGDNLAGLSSSMSSESHIASPPSRHMLTPQQTAHTLPLPQQTTVQTSLPTCNGTIPSIETCEEFASRIKQASRVDFSTFNTVSPDNIFGMDYLHPIVEYEHALKEVVNKHARKEMTNAHGQETVSEPDCVNCVPIRSVSSYSKDRPPYTYAALAVSAIYVSGKDCLSVDEVINTLYIMFKELNDLSMKKFRKAISKVLKTNKMFKKIKSELECYSVLPGRQGNNVFTRQMCFKPEARDKYALLIHHHIGFPSMLVDLGIETSEGSSRQWMGRPTSHRKKLPVDTDLLKIRNCAMSFEGRSISEKRKFNEYIHTSNKRTNLELPIRPCFHDDTDNEDDKLLKPLDALHNLEEEASARCCNSACTEYDSSVARHNSVCTEYDSSAARYNSACMENDSSAARHNSACMENMSLDVSYTDFKKGLGKVQVANPVVVYSSSSVIPTHHCTTPAPALVPSSCQNYYIPCVGTVQLVDVFLNGQTVKVPVQRVFM